MILRLLICGLLRAASIPEDAAGVVVQRLSDGATLVSHRAHNSMQPASTLKLLTALVALDSLGPAYRGRTQLRTRGELADAALHGDLILRGAGDVDLDWHAFERMLRLLRLQGIREIRGDLVLDLTLFRPARNERIRPAQLAAALKAAIASNWAPEFLASLPIVAVDGAMRRRLRDSPAAAHARIKTGTLRDVNAVAGYVKDEAGETYVVVAMLNHELATGKVARPILDALVDWVARGSALEAAPARHSAN